MQTVVSRFHAKEENCSASIALRCGHSSGLPQRHSPTFSRKHDPRSACASFDLNDDVGLDGAEREQIVATTLVFLQRADKVREGVGPPVHLAVFNDVLIA